MVYRVNGKNITVLDVEPVNDGALFPNTLIIPPGRYKNGGNTYNMTMEGLYRIFSMSNLQTAQHIVYMSDPVVIINGVQWLTTQSYVDDGLTNDQLTAKAQYSKVRTACGYSTLWCMSLLQPLGYQVRMVNAITAETFHNTTNDGHAMMEIYLNGKWVVFDFSYDIRFWKNGIPLNLKEVNENLPDGYDIEQMTTDTSYDVTGLMLNGYSLSVLFEPLADMNLLRDYFSRVLEITLVTADGTCYYWDTRKQTEFTAWHYILMTQSAWMNRFYP
jgi:hypothetical protein